MTFESTDDNILDMRAELMELADMQDLGSCAARRVGSSPTFRIKRIQRGRGKICPVLFVYAKNLFGKAFLFQIEQDLS